MKDIELKQEATDYMLEHNERPNTHWWLNKLHQAIAEERERVVWVKYKDKKPVIGQLVIFYRDIESRQIIATKWTKEEENYAEMNEITHWMPIEYPDLLASLDITNKDI